VNQANLSEKAASACLTSAVRRTTADGAARRGAQEVGHDGTGTVYMSITARPVSAPRPPRERPALGSAEAAASIPLPPANQSNPSIGSAPERRRQPKAQPVARLGAVCAFA